MRRRLDRGDEAVVDRLHRRRCGCRGSRFAPRGKYLDRRDVAMRDGIVALAYAAAMRDGIVAPAYAAMMPAEAGDRRLKLDERYPKLLRRCGEMRCGRRRRMRIFAQRRAVCGIRAFAVESRALRCDGDAVRQRRRIAQRARVRAIAAMLQALCDRPDRPDESRRITAVEYDRVVAVDLQVLRQPGRAAFLRGHGALIDAATIGDENRSHHAAILSAPPA